MAAPPGDAGKHSTQPERRRVAENSNVVRRFDDVSTAIAYIENGKVSWVSIYGTRFPGGPPADGKILYSVASLTKPITAETILRMASAGKLSLDEPISPYWIDPDVKDNQWNALLTPRICLSHETGFPNWRYQSNDVLGFQWEPGTKTGYSGEGYEYVARFAEKKTGQSFEALAKQYVFAPIGMNDTSYTPQLWWQRTVAPIVHAWQCLVYFSLSGYSGWKA